MQQESADMHPTGSEGVIDGKREWQAALHISSGWLCTAPSPFVTFFWTRSIGSASLCPASPLNDDEEPRRVMSMGLVGESGTCIGGCKGSGDVRVRRTSTAAAMAGCEMATIRHLE